MLFNGALHNYRTALCKLGARYTPAHCTRVSWRRTHVRVAAASGLAARKRSSSSAPTAAAHSSGWRTSKTFANGRHPPLHRPEHLPGQVKRSQPRHQ